MTLAEWFATPWPYLFGGFALGGMLFVEWLERVERRRLEVERRIVERRERLSRRR